MNIQNKGEGASSHNNKNKNGVKSIHLPFKHKDKTTIIFLNDHIYMILSG